MNRTPDALRRYRHFDMSDAKLRKRIDGGIDDRAECAGRAAFAGAADTELIRRAALRSP
jgi:hypothetical protein